MCLTVACARDRAKHAARDLYYHLRGIADGDRALLQLARARAGQGSGIFTWRDADHAGFVIIRKVCPQESTCKDTV